MSFKRVAYYNCKYFLHQWYEVIGCLLLMSVIVYGAVEYLMQARNVVGVLLAFCMCGLFAWWLKSSMIRAQNVREQQALGRILFASDHFSYYNCIGKELCIIKFQDICRIDILPTEPNASQTGLDETYWVIHGNAGERVVVSSLAENAWKLTGVFSEHLSGFNINKTLSALMSSRGMGHVVWRSPSHQARLARIALTGSG